MNHMLEALKKKMIEAKGGKPSLEIHIGSGHEPEENDSHHDMAQDDVAGPAPHMEHDIEPQHPDVPEHEMEHDDEYADEKHDQDPDHEDSSMLHESKEAEHEMGDGSEHHMKMLKALADHKSSGHSHKLSSMAADKAKEKMASIMKHKKGMA